MKFLCGNCKAKYQIADEKIAGRTLRMKCRRCSHDIVIRGDEGGAAKPAAKPAPARGGSGAGPAPRRRGGSSVGPAPHRSSRRAAGSALGADFRRQVSTGSHGAPARGGAALDQWHVAINDVPVGPIRRDEIARKVAAGAVNGDSLCWREGFDDWRPVRDVPELAAVLRQRPVAPPRPARPMGRGSVPGAARGGTGTRPKPRTRSGAGIPARGDQSRPAARSNVVPIGGRLGAAAAPAYEEAPDELDAEPTRVSDPLFDPSALDRSSADGSDAGFGALAAGGHQETATPTAEDPFGAFAPSPATESEIYEPRPARRGLPIGAWIAIAGAGAFGMMLAFMIGTKLILEDDDEPVAAVQQGGEGQAEIPEQVEPEIVTDVEEEPVVEEGEPEEGEPEAAEASGTGGGGGGGGTGQRRAAGSGGGGGSSGSSKQLTAEQRALIERFSESGGGPANIDVEDEPGGGSRNTGRGLNARQLTTVVSRNRPALRRCYETAIRGIGDPPAIRMDVELTVGRTGGVTRVNARGNDVGGLGSCIESTVRRWRFPSSGASTQTSFPVVFQPGG